MKYKLIAIDMDGTLLNGENQVSKGQKKQYIRPMKKEYI